MRYAIIENGIVVNVAAADEPLGANWVQSEIANIGNLYDGESFTAPFPSQEEIDAAWKALRAQRDAKLSASDWTQLADAPVDDLVWAVYRQALRDLPANTADPMNPVWPEMPA
jgi:hypothetical protein